MTIIAMHDVYKHDNGEDNDNVTWQSNRCPRIEDHSDILHQGDTDRAHCSCARNLSCRHVIPHIVQIVTMLLVILQSVQILRSRHVIRNFAKRTISHLCRLSAHLQRDQTEGGMDRR